MAQDTAQVIQFPTRRNVDRQAADAVAVLATARLINERTAVGTLRDLGCSDEEIDLVRAIYAGKRLGRI